MGKKIRILLLEDLPGDVKLIWRVLQKRIPDFERLVVETKDDFIRALDEFGPDIILSDHKLPSFDSHEALSILKATEMKIPFILITGTISEEFAVDVIKRGADDYILKDRLERLPTAVLNSLEKYHLEREKALCLNDIIRNERHYRALIGNIHDAIILLNEQGELIYQSPWVAELTGFGFGELGNKPLFEWLHTDDRQDFRELFQRAREQPAIPMSGQFRILHKEGHYIWMEGTVSNLLHDESVGAFILNSRDITERKRAHEKLEDILESIGDGFFAIDKGWIVTYWNNQAEKLMGIPRDQIVGRLLWEIFSDTIATGAYKKYHEAFSTGHVVRFEDRYMSVGKWYEVNAYPSDNGLSVYFKDITERKNSEIQLDNLNQSLGIRAKELADSNKELEQFAYIASHDLQEPLRMVISFLTQIEKKYSCVIDDKGRQYINFAVDGAKRMRKIILDLLEFSRIGKIAEGMEEVELGEIVNDIVLLYRKEIEETNAKIEWKDLPVVKAFKTPLRQVFQNLLSNALKYRIAGKPPLIAISCKQSKDCWQIAVKDNGIGIDSEYFEKIFVLFQRLHNNEEYSGTGLGLTICKKIIENMGGRIWVKSREGKGSNFNFTLPN